VPRAFFVAMGIAGRTKMTLLYAMHQRRARIGVASSCIGGGGAVALTVERAGDEPGLFMAPS